MALHTFSWWNSITWQFHTLSPLLPQISLKTKILKKSNFWWSTAVIKKSPEVAFIMWRDFSKTDTGGKSFGGRKGQRNLCVFLCQVAVMRQLQIRLKRNLPPCWKHHVVHFQCPYFDIALFMLCYNFIFMLMTDRKWWNREIIISLKFAAAFPGVGIHGLGDGPHSNQTNFDMVQVWVMLFNLR